jgi:hypothetical protein
MTSTTSVSVGSIAFFRTTTFYGKLIRFIQWMHYRKSHIWNHCAVIVKIDDDGTVWAAQMVRRCTMVRLQDISPKGECSVVSAPPGLNTGCGTAFAISNIGKKYAILTVIVLGINSFLPAFLNLDIGRGGTMECAGFAARTLEHTGWIVPNSKNPFSMYPAELYDFMKEHPDHLETVFIPSP